MRKIKTNLLKKNIGLELVSSCPYLYFSFSKGAKNLPYQGVLPGIWELESCFLRYSIGWLEAVYTASSLYSLSPCREEPIEKNPEKTTTQYLLIYIMSVGKNGFEEYIDLEILPVHGLPGFGFPDCVTATLVSSKDNNSLWLLNCKHFPMNKAVLNWLALGS